MAITLLPKQDKFIFSDSKYPAFIGGVGSGKTRAGCIRAILWADKGQDGVIVAPTFPMLRDATQETFFDLLNTAGMKYEFNKSDGTCKLGEATILFRSADAPDRLRGPNLSWFYLDEAAMMRELVWKVMLGRIRVGETSGWVTSTPAGMNWVYRHWIQEPKDKYQIIHASTRENRFLPKDYVQDLIDNYSGEFARQEIDGEFVAFEGLVYDEFSINIHVIESMDIPTHWTRVRGIDYGYQNPFVCLWGALDEDKRLYIYDEHYKAKTLLSVHAKKIQEREGKFDFTVADHDAQDNAEMQALGIYTQNAKKDVIAGISRVKTRLKVAGDGRPRLFITSNCVNLIKELQSYRWQPEKPGSNSKEEPVKEFDHACLIAGTKIATLNGDCVIESIRVGDMVLTRDGYKRVLKSECTNKSADVISVIIGDTKITGTGNHPIFCNNSFKPLEYLRYCGIINICKTKLSYLTESHLQSHETIIMQGAQKRRMVLNVYIKKFGSLCMEISRRGVISIIKMATGIITTLRILFASPQKNMQFCMSLERIYDRSIQAGIEARQEVSGIKKTGKPYGKISQPLKENAVIAERNIKQNHTTELTTFAQVHAKQHIDTNQESMTRRGRASSAEKNILLTNTNLYDIVPCLVHGWKEEKKQQVYNLTIEDNHEYFANGILVHNCDALRYIVSELDAGGIQLF